jgi:HD-GYP domain-containing protein (c-di-GMP phosphodiesterase class II)
MRFSDLNKAKPEPAPAEPKKPARLAAPPPAVKKAEPPVAPKAEPEPVQPPERQPTFEREEAVRQHVPAYKPSARQEARAAAHEPQKPFRELDGQAREVYGRVVRQAGDLLNAINQPYTEKYEAVLQTCSLAAETLKSNSVLLNYASCASAEDYLKAHTANTTIVALAMGLALNLDHQELKLLGFCAMAHDVGMLEYADLYSRETRLSEEEFSSITAHAESGAGKLDRIVDLDYKLKDRAKRIIMQSHERIDGSGYPDRLSGEEIDPLAQLIGMADVYEAMTHPRAWRGAINQPDVIKELIEHEGRGFTAKAVKALISAVSIYPPGSLVMLSTGEIARVLRLNKGSLTRPLAETLLDPEFAAISPAMVDLLEHPLTSIERPIGLDEVRSRNPKFAVKLDLARWWTDW